MAAGKLRSLFAAVHTTAAGASLLTPYPFQEAAITRLLMPGRRGLLLADEMGLGKTVSVISALNREPAIKRVLIVAPKSVLPVWRNELARWLTRPLSVGIASATKGMPKEETDVLLVNYDIIRKHRDELDARAPWDALVCDEAHYLKNPETLRTRALLGRTDANQLSRDVHAPCPGALRARRVWLLTGSPVLNKPLELFPLLRTLDPEGETVGTVRSFNAFRKRYCEREEGRWGVRWKGARNTAELRGKLLLDEPGCPPLMLRRTKAEVLTDLPSKHYQLMRAPPPAHAARAPRARPVHAAPTAPTAPTAPRLDVWPPARRSFRACRLFRAALTRAACAERAAIVDESVARNELKAIQRLRGAEAAPARAADADKEAVARLRVAELRERLGAAGLSTQGTKAELVARLLEAAPSPPPPPRSAPPPPPPPSPPLSEAVSAAPEPSPGVREAEVLESVLSAWGGASTAGDGWRAPSDKDLTWGLLARARHETALSKVRHAIELLESATESHKVAVFAQYSPRGTNPCDP